MAEKKQANVTVATNALIRSFVNNPALDTDEAPPELFVQVNPQIDPDAADTDESDDVDSDTPSDD